MTTWSDDGGAMAVDNGQDLPMTQTESKTRRGSTGHIISMRDQIGAALNEAVQKEKRSRACMLRLIQTAINDRDVANRAEGKDPISDAEIGDMLLKMIHQREASAAEYEASGRLSEAEEEREEIQIVRDLLPRQLDENDTRRACAQVIEEVDAGGLRDVGRCMNALKQKFPGQMDFGQASGIVKTMLR